MRDQEIEIQAAVEAKCRYEISYGKQSIQFSRKSFSEALEESCCASISSRKILGLLLDDQHHNGSQKFYKHFQHCDILKILKNSFYMLGWNVADRRYHYSLIKALRIHADFEVIQSWIDQSRPVFIIIFVCDNELSIFSSLHASTANTSTVLSTLNQAVKAFNIENEELKREIKSRCQSNDGSIKFQKEMHELLGDRDYDKFESTQHNELQQKIGYAKFGPPSNENGYDVKQRKIIDNAYKTICENNNQYCEFKDQVLISFLYNCLETLAEHKWEIANKNAEYNPLNDFMPVPVFIIRKCINSRRPCRIFIDNDNRVYKSWGSYLEDNKHHKCFMITPKDGTYVQNGNDGVTWDKRLSPACGIKRIFVNGMDIGSSVVGLASIAVPIAALVPAITVAPFLMVGAAITGATVGGYSMIRSAFQLHDRNRHGQSIHISNSEARGAYINIAAGSISFIGAGATTALSKMAARGVNISKPVEAVVDGISILNVTASGASIGNSTYQIIRDFVVEDQVPSTLTILQLSSSILFFSNAVGNFKTASTITKEAQMNTLTKFNESLRSNRHRKTFTRMVKETFKQNNGQSNTARAEIIKACRNIPDKNEVFAVLTRNTKLFNKEGIRFFAKDGEIKLNGMAVDLINLGKMPTSDRLKLITDIPAYSNLGTTSLPFTAEVSTLFIPSSVRDLCTLENLCTAAKYLQLIRNPTSVAKIVSQILQSYIPRVQNFILRLLQEVLNAVLNRYPNLNYTKYLPQNEPIACILKWILKYVHELARDIQTSEKYSLTQLSITCFERVLRLLLNPGPESRRLVEDLVSYICNLLLKKMFHYIENQQTIGLERRGVRTTCDICGGYYYTALKRNAA